MIEELSLNAQVISFLLFVVSGILSGGLYELIRMLRNQYSKSKKSDCLFDILSSFCLFVFILFSFITINNLEIHLNCIIGLLIGIVLYFTAFGAINRKILKFIIRFFQKIFKILLYPVIILCIILRKIFFCFIFLFSFPYNFAKKHIINAAYSFKKLIKRAKKI